MVPSEFQLRQDICEVGRRIYQHGFVASNDGNISIRLNEKEVLATPTGVSKGFMTPEMLVKVNMQGEQLSGQLKPSSELKMHLEIYRQRPDVRAVVHAHPPTATGFAVAGIPLDRCVLPEIIINLGSIPLVAYGTPSTDEVPAAVKEYIGSHDALLLANHGALTVGTDVYNAYYKMESLELFAKISLTARLLGNENVLSAEQVYKLMEIRARAGVTSPNPGCVDCGACSVSTREAPAATGITEEELREIITNVTRRVLTSLGDRKQ
ncbi:Methylthioribulose-1-phosphate dehydratase [Neomoorella glycerini]|uniref:Methylthioribulose-1-phosphate dehydratase n=1 Tax=Neomoorella glycerini TaxID=55779 RepID=A0A6I5ZUP0_9FIRM|nr:Methylthioribulose-1-phosphate dehydratase [Moorella glycerini]